MKAFHFKSGGRAMSLFIRARAVFTPISFGLIQG